MFLIAGLGNPGKQYEDTRHNLGFMVIDQLCHQLKVKFFYKKLYHYTKTSFEDKTIVLLKPKTYMNLSGNAVLYAINQYGIDFKKLLVICDDVHLPLGKLRIRGKGSDGGHKGIASIIRELKTSDFPRLRIGIGAGFVRDERSEYVLSPFSNSELQATHKSIQLAGQAVLSFITKGLSHTMNEYNGLC